MCAIAGILSINGKQALGEDLICMLKTMEHRGPDGSRICLDGKLVTGDLETTDLPFANIGLGHNLLSIVGTEVSQPLVKHGLVLVANAEIYNYRELKNFYDECYFTDSDCEVILTLVNKYYKNSLVDAVNTTIKELDGDYAFAISNGKELVVVRDELGVKPVYYATDHKRDLFAFASERKALWKLGIKDVNVLKPGEMILNNKTISKPQTKKKTMPIPNVRDGNESFPQYGSNYYKNLLKKVLIDSVKKRVVGLDRVGIIFSGGLDSSILAKLSKDLEVETFLYTVGTENSSDMKYAKQVANSLDLPLKSKIVALDDIKHYTGLVLNAIEEYNVMKIGVGMPSYIASELASQDGIRVMLSGQGADEIFAGYQRYTQFYQEYGEKTTEYLEADVSNLYHVNLQRDDAVTMANSVELRVPYLDSKVVNVGLNIPMKYKLGHDPDDLRKCILRRLALDLEVPMEAVLRPKKAAQYGSGIHRLLVKKVLKDGSYKAQFES
ncbi:asparagine synthase (glutamine-hydrolyzing) [Methanobacterium lacus]|uniref:Putative asparagine synthetase [glutamine-hydrolyzing] n=1 Tax=Methanobacterium lacus (strain AL-21) TaxID=877455 RepID=F0T6A5_METLA|nr:asparagine synthetase B [Methanobacterium lacus]ADZ09420.1 asparagine synthase (glutamine-hydrolyzing) [Methanobacterium lacus]